MALSVGNYPATGTVSIGVANPGTITSGGNASPGAISSVGNNTGGMQYGAFPDQGYTANTGVLGDQSTASTGGGGGGVPTYPNSNGGAVDSAAAQAAAAKAANDAAAAQKRDAITGLAHSIMNVYDTLYPQIDTAGADQGRLVNQKYDTEGKGLVDQFTQEFPTIGQGFAARGAYDSGYRIDAEGRAQTGLQNAQDQLGQGRNEDLAKVGQFVAGAKGSLDVNKGFAQSILDQIQGNNDVNQLNYLQNAIQQKLLEAQGQASQLNTQGGYIGQIQSQVPTTDQTAALQSQLSSIIQGQAPAPLKLSVGIKQIQTSGLPDAQKQQLINDFTSQVNTPQNLPSQPPAGA